MSALALAAVPGVLALALAVELQRRARLIARACHELRGPLAAARLGLPGAARAGGAAAILAAIDAELARAGHALEDLQAAGRGRAARLERRRVDLSALAAAAAGAAAPVAAHHGAELRLGEVVAGAWVLGDRRRLAQAAHNLLVNAAEHGGGQVRLAVRRRGSGFVLAVEDDGPGLPGGPGRLRPRRHAGRRGHGLAVAAWVAARHGGRLAAEPSPRGALVTLELPAAGA